MTKQQAYQETLRRRRWIARVHEIELRKLSAERTVEDAVEGFLHGLKDDAPVGEYFDADDAVAEACEAFDIEIRRGLISEDYVAELAPCSETIYPDEPDPDYEFEKYHDR